MPYLDATASRRRKKPKLRDTARAPRIKSGANRRAAGGMSVTDTAGAAADIVERAKRKSVEGVPKETEEQRRKRIKRQALERQKKSGNPRVIKAGEGVAIRKYLGGDYKAWKRNRPRRSA